MTAELKKSLNTVLADYHIFYQKLRNYHWNVKGPSFFKLHETFEKLYDGVAETIDEIAERILTRGDKPDSTLKDYLSNATLKEDEGNPDADTMVQNILKDYESLNSSLRNVVELAEKANDSATANMMEELADGQEKTAWMLRAYLA